MRKYADKRSKNDEPNMHVARGRRGGEKKRGKMRKYADKRSKTIKQRCTCAHSHVARGRRGGEKNAAKKRKYADKRSKTVNQRCTCAHSHVARGRRGDEEKTRQKCAHMQTSVQKRLTKDARVRTATWRGKGGGNAANMRKYADKYPKLNNQRCRSEQTFWLFRSYLFYIET
jgi:hypothetical protein